jgi:hypothetical protein
MKYTILEDHSPYYVTFTYPGFEDVVDYCRNFKHHWNAEKLTIPMTHWALPRNIGRSVLKKSQLPDLGYLEDRVSLFITRPGAYYRPHKDAGDHRISINYPIQILDQNCRTQWYSDKQLDAWPIDQEIADSGTSRESQDFQLPDKEKLTPLKSVCFQEGVCILFNTDIFHDFDNSQSEHVRVMLTIRLQNAGEMYFDDLKEILFK